jgi:hypothetical protein
MHALDIQKANQKKQQRASEHSPYLLSRGRRSRVFFTEDSHLYISSQDREMQERNAYRVERGSSFDSVFVRYETKETMSVSSQLYARAWKMKKSFLGLRDRVVDPFSGVSFSLSPLKSWNFSIVGAILFGMISMSFIYKSFGQVVSAQKDITPERASITETVSQREGQVLGEAVEFIQKSEAQYLEERKKRVEQELTEQRRLEQIEEARKEEFRSQIREMVKGYPIEKMLPYIFEQDEIVASYLIAIAKKESNWGKRVPVLNGEDCFNYWGYRGIRDRMGSGGHTCFDSRRDGVETVGKRIAFFVHEKKRETPEELVVWKCGFSCAGHSSYSVKKWIDDVDFYFSKMYKSEDEKEENNDWISDPY